MISFNIFFFYRLGRETRKFGPVLESDMVVHRPPSQCIRWGGRDSNVGISQIQRGHFSYLGIRSLQTNPQPLKPSNKLRAPLRNLLQLWFWLFVCRHRHVKQQHFPTLHSGKYWTNYGKVAHVLYEFSQALFKFGNIFFKKCIFWPLRAISNLREA